MAGHSHWARIKRAKAVTDARRGRSWSKLSRAIIVAARNGGGDPDGNLALRYAIDAARAENMPKDTIERAIKKGAGELDGVSFEELIYEGYGPGGAAIFCTVLTDNRNRTAPEIKKIFEMNGGNMGATNSVAWMFSKRALFVISKDAADEDALTNIALECGANDVKAVGDAFELDGDPGVFEPMRQALEKAGIKSESAEITMAASTNVTVAGENAAKLMKLIDTLEEHDDVQKVYGNYEIPEEDLAKIS